jgi:ferric-dicitrate binding protein FerR (iron transport regulator)
MPVRRILALTMTFLLAGIPAFAAQTSLGVVTQATLAHLNNADASAGATVYEGDRLTTSAKGAMALRSGTVQLILSEDSSLFLSHDAQGLAPRLERGTAVFHVEGNEGFRVTASDVSVRALSAVPTVGQVTLETCYVFVTARVQSLQVTAGKETKTIEEGKSYRVALRDKACAPLVTHGGAPSSTAAGSFWPRAFCFSQ